MSEKLDVCIVTMRGLSEDFFSMLRRAIPINDIIIDDHTTPLGKARQNVIRQVKTDKFVFVDDDVFLPEGWYERISKYCTDDSIGWLEGWAIPTRPEWYHKWSESRLDGARPEYIEKDRGFTLDTIIRSELVKDWVPEVGLDFFEDLSLTRHVRNKGFKVLRVPIESEHRITYSIFDQTKKAVRQTPDLDWKKRAFKTVASGAKATLKTHDVRIFFNSVKLSLYMLF